MKKLLVASFLTSLFLFVSPFASAQYGQYGQPAPSESILIDKQVGRPAGTTKGGLTSYDYVDNLTPSDTRFTPGAVVMFKIRVKNTSSIVLNNVMITDKIPQYVEAIEGPGTYDANARTISFNAGTFNSGEEKVYNFKMQWLTQDNLPADRGLICVSNYARAYTNNASDDDTAQACVEKQVVNVTQTPKAGPEMGFVMLLGELGLLGTGIKLALFRRK